jgi:hypothetical protein
MMIIIVIPIIAVLMQIMIIIIIVMGNGDYLFDGSDFSKSLYRLVPIAVNEGINLPLHTVADEVVILLPARYNNNKNNNSPPQLTKKNSVTLLLHFSPSAIKRPPTSVNSLPLCIAHRHTRRQHQTS